MYNDNSTKPLESFVCTIEYLGIKQQIRIHVLENAYGPPLLGRDFYYMFKLKITHLGHDIQFADDNIVEHLKNKFSYVCEPGLGKFSKGLISIKLKLPDTVTPKFFRARSLPFSIKAKV